jgi:predicted nucleotidyltransferase component of viral defense system
LQKFDIRSWVNQNPDYRPFRQAVHTVLTAIAGTPSLQTTMIMKGGVLLALSYSSPRFTKDIDFSTAIKRSDFDLEDFRRKLKESLIETVESLNYGLDCRIQSCLLKPPHEEATMPTIRVSIGYAYKDQRNAHKRLLAGRATTVIGLDYSLNEPVEETDMFELGEGSIIHTYSLVEMVAEKFRAILQQNLRKRARRQDIYDLNYVLSEHPQRDDPNTKLRILKRLIEKSRIRNLTVDSESMSDNEIRRRTESEYKKLADEIEGDLPPFDNVYAMVEAFYRGLPWEKV